MTILAKRNLDVTIEKKIATAAIISDKFLKEIFTIYDHNYIKNGFIKTVLHWCTEYYSEYDKAPKNNIQHIFDLEKPDLSQEESDIIEAFLTQLSQQYEEDQGINEDYVLDSALKYFKKRELEITAGNISRLTELGRIDEAEEQLTKYKKVARLTSGWYNPFSEENVRAVFEKDPDGLLKLPGELGRMIGPMERTWVVGVMGAFGRGKTWWLLEMAVLGLLHGLKVTFISLEMSKTTMNKRFYKRLTAFGEEETEYIYPVFDCYFNQMGECGNPKRKNRERLIGESGELPQYTREMIYKPCTECRGTKEYRMATWFATLERPKFTFKNTLEQTEAFNKMYGRNFKAITYPKFSANLGDIDRDLDILEEDGFISDMIIIDHAGILRPESAKKEKRDSIDETWKIIGQMASKRNCLLFSAWQANRASIYKKQMDQEGVSEWIGILGHVDIFMAINQTKEEKRNHQQRIGLLKNRDKEFSEDETCVILQQFNLGQVYLDSERVFDIN